MSRHFSRTGTLAVALLALVACTGAPRTGTDRPYRRRPVPGRPQARTALPRAATTVVPGVRVRGARPRRQPRVVRQRPGRRSGRGRRPGQPARRGRPPRSTTGSRCWSRHRPTRSPPDSTGDRRHRLRGAAVRAELARLARHDGRHRRRVRRRVGGTAPAATPDGGRVTVLGGPGRRCRTCCRRHRWANCWYSRSPAPPAPRRSPRPGPPAPAS